MILVKLPILATESSHSQQTRPLSRLGECRLTLYPHQEQLSMMKMDLESKVHMHTPWNLPRQADYLETKVSAVVLVVPENWNISCVKIYPMPSNRARKRVQVSNSTKCQSLKIHSSVILIEVATAQTMTHLVQFCCVLTAIWQLLRLTAPFPVPGVYGVSRVNHPSNTFIWGFSFVTWSSWIYWTNTEGAAEWDIAEITYNSRQSIVFWIRHVDTVVQSVLRTLIVVPIKIR